MQTKRKAVYGARKASMPTVPFTFARHTLAHEGHPERNEDTILIDQRRGLAAVFDGVGGAADGDVASRLVARVVRLEWQKVLKQYQPRNDADLLTLSTESDLQEILRTVVCEAQNALSREGERRVRRSEESDGADGYPHTTAVLAVLCRRARNYLMGIAHVGDSRAYLLRPDAQLSRLTSDDGYFGLKIKDQTISEDDALRIDQATHADQLTSTELQIFERRNGITQSLGHPSPRNPTLTIHTAQIEIGVGSRILLCSDGVHDNLTDAEIAAVLKLKARTTLARHLVQQARQRSSEECLRAKRDDMSAIVITCTR